MTTSTSCCRTTKARARPSHAVAGAFAWARREFCLFVATRISGRPRRGAKDRPCVVVLVVADRDSERLVIVAPITHRPPVDPEVCIELPLAVKRHLRLDSQCSWTVCDEVNEFVWPGYDLRPIPGLGDRNDYGFLPPHLFAGIVRRIADLKRLGRGAVTPRT
jgi:hypothetical protein